MKSNPLVEFLASYGPQASSNNLYDEFVVDAAERTGCRALEFTQPLVAELVEMFRSDHPRSVILTGTAGDGKTYTARRVAAELCGNGNLWDSTQKIFDLPVELPCGRRLRVIKDLSELNEEDKGGIFPDLRRALSGEFGSDLFIVCVNDGHLLKFFRDRRDQDDVLYPMIVEMLRRDEGSDADCSFQLHNMSRSSHQELVDKVIDAIVDHPGWKDCAGCPALNSTDAPCPIRANREILGCRGTASMRARLNDMVRMAAADGRHLSIRQLILLAVNIMLGDRKGTARSLLTCRVARTRATRNEYASTNPYGNAFGINLSERERFQYGAFAVLAEFGVGFETNNFFDDRLLEACPDLPDDPLYGSRIFSRLRRAYCSGIRDDAQEFKEALRQQRFRLFFSVDPDSGESQGENPKDPWNMSVFKHGRCFIALANGAATNRVPHNVKRDIILGLNRMMTGELTSTHDHLWITAPTGVYLGREIPLLAALAGPNAWDATVRAEFKGAVQKGKAPVLRVTPTAFGSRDERFEELALRPTLVECLMRVANGALPASFSSECRQEIEQFQLKVVALLNHTKGTQGVSPREVRMSDGILQAVPIVVPNRGGW